MEMTNLSLLRSLTWRALINKWRKIRRRSSNASPLSLNLNMNYMYYRLCIVFVCLLIFIGCKNSIQPIVKTADYEKFMHIVSPDSMHSIRRIKADMDFWMQRLEKNPDDVVAKVSLAGLHGARFKVGGDINDIHTSDSLYIVANPLFKTNSSSLYRSLATNCITQHKFQQAQRYLDTALTMGDDLYLTYLMRCDVAMELG